MEPNRRSRIRRRLVWTALAVVLVAVGVTAGWRTHDASPVMRYQTLLADRGPVVATVTAGGTVSAVVTVQVGSQVSGRIKDILVDFNSPVKKGQVIARLDPLLFEASVKQTRAGLATAQSSVVTATAQADNARHQYERSTSLLQRRLLSQADFDTAQSNYEVAEAQLEGAKSNLELARAALEQADVNLGYTTIVSPIDGVVVSRNVDVGQTVAASLQSPVLFVIANDLRKMQVDANVSEADVGKLRAGMLATFSVDAYVGESFGGTIRQVRNASTTIQNVVTYDVVIDVENRDLKLKPGMTATVTFVVARKDAAVRVGNLALRFQPDPALLQRLSLPVPRTSEFGVERTVWVLRDGRPQPVAVEIGISDGSVTEILHGDVKAGDALITDMALVPRRRFGIF